MKSTITTKTADVKTKVNDSMETEKAIVLKMLTKWRKKGLVTDKTGNNFQTEFNNVLLVNLELENAFPFLSELQTKVDISHVRFHKDSCTIFTPHWLDIGVFFNR